MKNFSGKVSLGILFCLFFGVFSSSDVFAASGDLRLTTSPLPISLRVEPGNSVSTQIRIKNDGIDTENLKIGLMKFKANEKTGMPMLFDRESGDDYFDWVTFSENTFELPSNEWKTVSATFTVPQTASLDYYYAIVFSRAEEKVNSEERQTVVTGGTAVLVLLEVVVPDAKREVKVVNFSVDKAVYEFLPANFSVDLKNVGNVHVAPRGNIFISRGDGQKDVAILEVNLEKGLILPNSPRSFQESWTDGFPVYVEKQEDGKVLLDKDGKQIQDLKWNFSDVSKLRWGKYVAKLLLVYDDGKRDVPIEAEVSFWVIPWRLLIGVLFIFIFVLIGFRSMILNIWRRIKMLFAKKEHHEHAQF